jgi:hypothetical protein
MGYFKTMQIQEQDTFIPSEEDWERIWLQDEIEMALDAGDYDRASQLMSQLDPYIQ